MVFSGPVQQAVRSSALIRFTFCCLAALSSAVSAYEPFQINDDAHVNAHPILGLNTNFGRWNGTINLVYDPDGAPQLFSDNDLMLSLINQTIAQLETVSGIKFQLTGIDSTATDDAEKAIEASFFGDPIPDQDGIVRISWKNLDGGGAGEAGPSWASSYDENLGYTPFYDGYVVLANNDGALPNNAEVLLTLVHEFGHLVGLGHSDNPDSMMYANPYNNLPYPRADDIRILQALYGQPSTPVQASKPLSQWVYTAPAAAPASVTEFLFKGSDADSAAAGFYLGLTEISSITASLGDEEYLELYSGGNGSTSNNTAISIAATVIATDPSGYIYTEQDMTLSCDANTACIGASASLAQIKVMKTIPGTWKVYIVDKSNNQTLLEKTLEVTTTASYNQAPVASLTAVAGNSDSEAVFTLSVTDAESQNITANWHAPGPQQTLSNALTTGGSAEQALNFSLAGKHTFFVELKDNGERYGSAGSGYQTVLQVEATLPITGSSSLSIINSGSDAYTPAATVDSAILQTLTNRSPLKTILHKGGKSAAEVRIGASTDNGVSEATTVTSSDTVLVAGRVTPLPEHVGQKADLFYVILSNPPGGGNKWWNMDVNGNWQTWNARVADLIPSVSNVELSAENLLQMYNNTLGVGLHRFYIGYSLVGESALYYNNSAMRIEIAE